MRSLLTGLAAGFFLVTAAPAQILMSGGTYAQNFDSLASSGSPSWTDNSTLPGWYVSKSVAPTSVTSYTASAGTSSTGAIYSFGTNDANGIADRALGSVASATPGNFAYGVCFTNDTGLAQSNVTVSYTGEEWRNGGNTSPQVLAFSYLVSSNPITNSDAVNANSWTAFVALNFTTPTVGATLTPLDGNSPANQQVLTNVVLTGVVVPAGQEIFLRWFDVNDSGNDHAVALDNLTVSFFAATNSPTTNAPVITAQPQSQSVNAGDTVTFTVVASDTAPLSYQWSSNNVAVAGATNSSFTLAGVTTNLNGSTYFATVTNIAGATNSQTATLTVNSAAGNSPAAATQTRILRIAAYNIAADFTNNIYPTWSSVGPPLPGLIAPPSNPTGYTNGGVLAGIGEELVNGNAQPPDILALEETTSNPLTVAPIVNGLNLFYGVAGMYSNSSYQATESGNNPAFGNGPNAVVFNTRTVQLLASVPVDPLGGTGSLGSSSGEYREVMRYQFAPAGVATNAANVFYIFVSHYKSGAGTTAGVTNSRNNEAIIIRNNTATLPVAARILHVGDFNTGDASEPMYATLTAPGTNQLIDPLNPARSLTTNFDGSTTPANLTDSSTYLQYRDDYQVMTTNVYYGTSGGLMLIPGTYHHFGNNGTTAYQTSVNAAGNTAFNNRLVTNGPVFVSAAQLFLDLANASDHLPVVADYTIPIPAPQIIGAKLSGTNLVFSVTNGITNAVYFVLMNTNLSSAFTNWTAVASNTATAGNFSFTATNVFSPAAPQRFFILQTK